MKCNLLRSLLCCAILSALTLALVQIHAQTMRHHSRSWLPQASSRPVITRGPAVTGGYYGNQGTWAPRQYEDIRRPVPVYDAPLPERARPMGILPATQQVQPFTVSPAPYPVVDYRSSTRIIGSQDYDDGIEGIWTSQDEFGWEDVPLVYRPPSGDTSPTRPKGTHDEFDLEELEIMD